MNRNLPTTLPLTLLLVVLFTVTGCDRVVDGHRQRLRSEADAAAKNGDYVAALNLYESSLESDAASADIHFQMAIICESKINDPLGALFHFRRCERLDPKGPHAAEAKKSYERLEPAVVTILSKGPALSKRDAAVLKNENIDLRNQVNQLKEQVKAQAAAARLRRSELPAGGKGGKAEPPDPELVQKMGGRTYIVEPGDTLAAIARKVYKDKGRAQDIQDANINNLPDVRKLQVGQVLIIPK